MKNPLLPLCILLTLTITPTVHAATTDPTTTPATQPDNHKKLGIYVIDENNYANGKAAIQFFGGNLVVNAVLPNSRAQRMGMQIGDAIKRINGQDMHTPADIIAQAQSGDLLDIDIIRNHNPMTLNESP